MSLYHFPGKDISDIFLLQRIFSRTRVLAELMSFIIPIHVIREAGKEMLKPNTDISSINCWGLNGLKKHIPMPNVSLWQRNWKKSSKNRWNKGNCVGHKEKRINVYLMGLLKTRMNDDPEKIFFFFWRYDLLLLTVQGFFFLNFFPCIDLYESQAMWKSRMSNNVNFLFFDWNEITLWFFQKRPLG